MARGYRVGDIHPTMETKIEEVPCGCGRSHTGLCTGLHSMTEEEYEKWWLEQLSDQSLKDLDGEWK